MLELLLEIAIGIKNVASPEGFLLDVGNHLFLISRAFIVPKSSCLPIPEQIPLPTPTSSQEVLFVKSKILGKVKVESSFIRVHSKNKFYSREEFVTDWRVRIYREGEILYESKSIPDKISFFFLRDIDRDGEPEIFISTDQKRLYTYHKDCHGYLSSEESSYEPTDSERLANYSEVTKFGNLTAHINYVSYDGKAWLDNLTLELSQHKITIFKKLIEKRIVANSGVSVSMRLIDFNNDGDPAIVIKHNSGTSGCCNHTLIYYFDYQKQGFNVIDYRLPREDIEIEDIDGDGKWEIRSRNSDFNGEAKIYNTPTLIQHFVHGEFFNVTQIFPERIRKDNEHLSASLQHWKGSIPDYDKGYRKSEVAAFLANKYMLGEGEEGWDMLKKVYHESDREEFFDKLAKWLRERGYSH